MDTRIEAATAQWKTPADSLIVMPARLSPNQIAFRYRTIDSATGATRATAKRLAEHLGVDEMQAIHQALHDLAARVLPQYAADDGPLIRASVRQIKRQVPLGAKRSVRSSLFDTTPDP